MSDTKSRRWITKKRVGITTATLAALYLLVGFVGLPLLVKHVVVPRLSEALESHIVIESVRMNPLTFSAELRGLEFRDAEEAMLSSFERVRVNAQASSLWREGFVLKEFTVDRPEIAIIVKPSGEVNQEILLDHLIEMVRDFEPPRLRLAALAINDGVVIYEDHTLDKPLKLEATPINVAVNDFDTFEEHVSPYSVTIATQAREKLDLNGTIQLDPLTLQGELELSDIALAQYSPYLKKYGGIEINKGTFGTTVGYDVHLGEPLRLAFEVPQAVVDSLAADLYQPMRTQLVLGALQIETVEADLIHRTITVGRTALGQSVVVCDRVAPEPTEQSPPAPEPTPEARVDTEEPAEQMIDFTGPWEIALSELAVADHQTLVVDRLDLTDASADEPLREPESLVQLEALTLTDAKAGTAPVVVTADTLLLAGLDLLMQINEDGSMLLPGAFAVTPAPEDETAADSPPPSTPEPEAGEPIELTLNSLILEGGRVTARDLMQALPVEVVIDEMQAEATNVATVSSEPTDLKMTARVNDGTLEVLGSYLAGENRSLKADANLTGLTLVAFDGYSRTYLGHTIDRGTVDLNIGYTIDGDELKGNNTILLDRFYLGESVPSEDALNVPVKLGVNLMRDLNEQIKLDVPVTGDLSDPQFSFGKVIVQALVNTFGKVATSPMSFVASTFGEGDEEIDVSKAVFEPATTDLEPGEATKLDLLAKALQARPRITLIVRGGVDDITEGMALRQEAVRAELRRAAAERLPSSDPRKQDPSTIPVSTEQYRDEIIRRFAQLNDGDIALESSLVRPAVDEGEGERRGVFRLFRRRSSEPSEAGDAPQVAIETAEEFEEAEVAVLKSVELSPPVLNAMAERRAAEVRDRMLAIDPALDSRVKLSNSDAPPPPVPGVVFELTVE